MREWNVRLETQRKGRQTTKLLVGSKLDGGDANLDRMAVVTGSKLRFGNRVGKLQLP